MIEVEHFGAGEGAERIALGLSITTIANHYVGNRKEFNAASETRFFLAHSTSQRGDFSFGGKEVQDTVGFTVVGTAKNDSSGSKIVWQFMFPP